VESNQILERIISRGGIMGACAKRYLHNKEQADQFILECYYQCHNNSAIRLWGEDLIIEIKNYIRHHTKIEIMNDHETKIMETKKPFRQYCRKGS
jgi:hypothetical protein